MLKKQGVEFVRAIQTGQITCHDARGLVIDCTGSGEGTIHGGFRTSMSWNRSWIAARTARRFPMDIPS